MPPKRDKPNMCLAIANILVAYSRPSGHAEAITANQFISFGSICRWPRGVRLLIHCWVLAHDRPCDILPVYDPSAFDHLIPKRIQGFSRDDQHSQDIRRGRRHVTAERCDGVEIY